MKLLQQHMTKLAKQLYLSAMNLEIAIKAKRGNSKIFLDAIVQQYVDQKIQ